MMSHFNQQFSELEDIPLERMMFYIELFEAENDYIDQEQKKLEARIKKGKR